MFYRLQHMHNNDINALKTKRIVVTDSSQNKNPLTWMEWQANTFASCLLMPRRLVMEVTSLVCELEFECKEGAKQTDQERKEEAVFLTALQDKLFADHQLASELHVTIKDVFRVSESAAFYRLRSLNLLPEESQLLPSGIVVY